jgi:hypothetical protein
VTFASLTHLLVVGSTDRIGGPVRVSPVAYEFGVQGALVEQGVVGAEGGVAAVEDEDSVSP